MHVPTAAGRSLKLLKRPSCAAFVQRLSAAADVDQDAPSTSGRSSERWTAPREGALYSTHVPLSAAQKAAVAVVSAVGASLECEPACHFPRRADLVAALGETTGAAALSNMLARMQSSPSGRQILAERPRITDETLEYAGTLPEGTFGHAYAQFMGRRRFRADERPPVRFVDDGELAYVAARAREVHDLWHVLFGCPTTVLGELALKALEFVQTGMPMAALSVAGAQWRLSARDRGRLATELLPWALRSGTRCADLICLPYERHLQARLLGSRDMEDLEEVRSRWRITPAPAAAMASRPAAQPRVSF